MIWKTLPEEYNWEYGFDDYDLRLANNEENENANQTLQLSPDNHIITQLPLTKRNVHAYIVIELSSLSFSDTTEFTKIKELVVKNANQTLKIKDIDSKTVIEINTKEKTILLNDVEPQTMEAVLVQAADAISASRPGARRETLEAYIKRLQNLEEIADSFDGVEKSFAIQAGREVRIIVKPDKINDDQMTILARDVAKKVENEMDYPGQIKVNVIRETRTVDFAR